MDELFGSNGLFIYLFFITVLHSLYKTRRLPFFLTVYPPCVNLVLSRLRGAYYNSNAIATITKTIISWGLLQFRG